MKKGVPTFVWLVAVVALSAIVLWKLELWQERREQQNGYEGNKAKVMLIAYEGDHFPGSDASGSLLNIGCNDLLVPFEIPVVSPRLSSVLTALRTYVPPQGLHNPFGEKKTNFDRVEELENGKSIVSLQGDPEFGGICDVPRFQEQLQKTIELYTKTYEIRLNDSEGAYRCLGDMSGNCE
jgi:hypothetical protein